jgi:hypothetical protein
MITGSLQSLSRNPLIVLTDPCLNFSERLPCTLSRLELRNITDFSDVDAVWNLRRRIHACIPFTSAMREQQKQRDEHDLEVMREGGCRTEHSPLATVDIFCGPCICALITAMNVAGQYKNSDCISFSISVDDCIPTSCMSGQDLVQVLSVLRDQLDDPLWPYYDSRELYGKNAVDLPSLETRIHILESGVEFPNSHPADTIQNLLLKTLGVARPDALPVITTVIIGEAHLLQDSLEAAPFPRKSSKPKPAEIYCLEKDWDSRSFSYVFSRQFKGRYPRSSRAIKIEQARAKLTAPMTPITSAAASASISAYGSRKRQRTMSTAGDSVSDSIEGEAESAALRSQSLNSG